jgi:diguanylate cyclase (GGDEF)-like protein
MTRLRQRVNDISSKVGLLALLCAVLPCVLISIVAYVASRDALERAVKVELSGTAEDQLAMVTASLKRADIDLRTWSMLHAMQNVLIDDVDGVVQHELSRLQTRYPNFADLIVINPNGLVVAAARQDNRGKNLADLEPFQIASRGSPFQGLVEFHDLIGQDGISISAPIRADYDPDTVIGVLLGVIDWSRVQARLASARIWGARQDADHRLILTTIAGQVLYGTTVATNSGHLLRDNEVYAAKIGDEDFLVGTAKALAPDGVSLPEWELQALVSSDIAYADVVRLRNRIAIISSFIVLGALAVGAMAATRWIVRPVRAVTSAMTRVSKGDVDFAIEDRGSRDEIGQMLQAISVFRSNLLRDNALIHDRERALITQNVRFDAALSNMSQGLSMFDAMGRLAVCNAQFAHMYGLPPEFSKPGVTDSDIHEYCISTGISPSSDASNQIEPATAVGAKAPRELLELSDGRVIAVANQAMSGGGWVSTHEDVTERRRAEAQISHMARHDSLTDLPNRVQFRQKVDEALERLPRGEGVAVLCLDLDYFKSVNDTLGHPIGDALLRQVAERLRSCVREGDTVARLSGDEFAAIQLNADQPESATVLAQRMIEGVSAPYEIEGHQIVIGTSVGISIAPTDGIEADNLLKNADMALYRAKADGRSTYRFFEPEMDAKMQARRRLELDLRKAVAQGEFELYYQPLVGMESGKITGFEALVRWHHPERGLVPPNDFIPLAEEIGLIVPLGDWVLRQACATAAKWPEDVRVAVNLSPAQFSNRDLVVSVFNALAKAPLAPNRLELEITETVLLQDTEATLTILHQLRDMGVRISMDDFGTGYSSLSYLRSFPFDKIKIDQSFIQDLSRRDDSVVIVRAVTTIGASLGISTTAEGVETAEQLEKLREEGCTEVQGFFLGRPCPVDEATELLWAARASETSHTIQSDLFTSRTATSRH